MKWVYVRCNNENVCKKREEELKNQGYKLLPSYKTTSGKKILKKEIKDLKDYIERFNIKELDIYYLDEKSRQVLEKELKIPVKVIDSERKGGDSKEKVKTFFKILETMKERDISAEDDIFRGISKQTALNYLDELKEAFPDLIEEYKKGKKRFFKLVKGENIIREVFENLDRLSLIQEFLSSLSEEDIKILSEETKKFLRKDRDIVFFKTRPFEKLNREDNITFRELKKAIKEKRYVDIYDYMVYVSNLKGHNKTDYENIIPLKIVFMENNWYLAGVFEEIVRFFRISFIGDILVKEKVPKYKFKKKYFEFLETFETPFTLYNEKWKKAILKIDKSKVKYFKNKSHFPKQKELEIDKEGNLIIECQYTQPLEILPMIKKWLPDIEVVKSEDGKIERLLKKDIKTYLQKFS